MEARSQLRHRPTCEQRYQYIPPASNKARDPREVLNSVDASGYSRAFAV
jgi:hypothetical protein